MISIIIPTLGTREAELKRLLTSIKHQTTEDYEVIVVSQDHHDQVDTIIKESMINVNHIKIDQRGLSHARNIGMKHANGTIVTFSDDDCWYKERAFEEVVFHFRQTNDHVACFQIFDQEKNQYYKDYPDKPKGRLSFQEIFRKSSIEIFINLTNLDKNEINFDEQFGLGAKYPSGEENIFLYQFHRRGYKISYSPKVVVYHMKPAVDTRLNYNSFISKGPLFKRIYNTPIGLVMLTLLFVKKFSQLEKPFVLYIAAVRELFRYKKVTNKNKR